MDGFRVSVTGAGRDDLLLAMALAFRSGNRIATHMHAGPVRGLLFLDLSEGIATSISAVTPLSLPADHVEATGLAMSWLMQHDRADPDAPIGFTLFGGEGGIVHGEPGAIVAIRYHEEGE